MVSWRVFRHCLLGLALCVVIACGDDAPPGGDAAVSCEDDSECDDGVYCNGVERCDARRCVMGAAPCAGGCDEATRMCDDDTCPDADEDGFPSITCGGSDCDDGDPDRYPGNTEVCDADGVDEDCNPSTLGDRDADGDGAVDATCCNGALCGTDCDDSSVDVGPLQPEVCDGEDDDCDGAVDEDFECAVGRGPRDCRNLCGSVGSQTCTNACVWSACLADEEGPAAPDTCNNCDDDSDGTLDEGFDCVVGTFTSCTTACGTAGQGNCSASCELPAADPAECVAETETCNYCDDDGDGTFADDRGLVEPSAVLATWSGCGAVTSGAGASCATRQFPAQNGGAFVEHEGPGVRLSDGSTTNGEWQAWTNTPAMTGWGRVNAIATVFVDTPGTAPDGGFAMVMAKAPCGSGPFNDVGVPLDCDGLAFEWRFAGTDTVTIRRLAGDGSAGTELFFPMAATVPSGWRVGAGESRYGVRLVARYWPAASGTEAVTLSAQHPDGAPEVLLHQWDGDLGVRPSNEFRTGDPIYLGVVSATGSVATTVDWMLDGRFQFAVLPPGARVSAVDACAL